jgi:adhesin/invasin
MYGLRRVTLLLLFSALGCGGGDLVLPSGAGPVEVMVIQGDRQDGAVGAPLPDSLRVRVVDTLGAGVSGQQVAWVVALGGGSIVPATDTSDVNGYASAEWTLGQEAGANVARAVLPAAGFVTFTAVASRGQSGGGGGGAGAPSPGQSSLAAMPDSIPVGSGSATITVTVRDDQGNPVPGAVVSLEASGAGNTLIQPSSPTGADGRAPGTLTGTAPGAIVVMATVNGVVHVTQTAQVTVTDATAPTVDHFAFRLQPPHDVRVGEQIRLEVALVDASGNVVPLTGILMYLGLFPDGSDVPTNSRLVGNRFVATENGVALFNLAVNTAGSYRFRALTDQLPELGPHGPEPYLFSLPFGVH